MTSLQVLDLSHNDLDDLNPEEYPFSFPENLTELYLSGNRLQVLPNDAVANLTMLSILDISNNLMEIFNYTILSKVRHGLNLSISGKNDTNFQTKTEKNYFKIKCGFLDNRVLCNCNIRPLKHYISTFLEVPEIYSSILCDLPAHLRDHNLINVTDEALQCSKYEADEKSDIDDFAVLPDLRFREVY